MNTISNKLRALTSLTMLLAFAGASYAGTKSESEIYAPSAIHHYASNGGAPTVTVLVPHHMSFESGKYVSVEGYSAEAPLPHDKYCAAYWIPTSGLELGHWAKN